MKLEVIYKVQEVTRYVITKRVQRDDHSGGSIMFSNGDEFGVYERRQDAEAVADALERTEVARLLKGA